MKSAFERKERYDMEDLLAIVALLRDPKDGCAWDKVQTHESIRKNFIEETYEVADAIDLQDSHLLCEELGDVLLQVALHSQMEAEQGTFSFEDVCTGICKKLIYRHPHIFGDVQANDPDEALRNWEALKRQEKHRETLAADLASIPQSFPALMRAAKLSKRAAAHGKSRDLNEAMASLTQSVDKLCDSVQKEDRADVLNQLGSLLFDAADIGRQMNCDAEEALEQANKRFLEKVSTD
ncbi:nucleoside triphosphate pyrophosphohydrolase [uncultured Ruthenibacterium sp.]|uniref:nucleoside triphosphate pyrophosphohydrolase n=1 Tax=uncultured Ruthenibacterium sp. TaxID=1905347 RepID=UPI00349EC0C6